MNLYLLAKSPRNIIYLLVGMAFLVTILKLDSWIFVNRVANAALPFKDGDCLYYSYTNQNLTTPTITKRACFKVNPDGSFVELATPMQTTFNKKGYSRLTEEDVANWRKSLGANDPFFYRISKKLDFHNIYYGPSAPDMGEIFYNDYPIKETLEFNDKKAYVVEVTSDLDPYYISKGPIGKLIHRIANLNFLAPEVPNMKSDRKVIERFYYNFNTGILEGTERIIEIYDDQGKTQQDLIETYKFVEIKSEE